MDYKATLMALVLVSSALAGCTGDPDGGGGDEIDSDALQDLFDEHFQDFLNNTTITVNNHYHNNTTVVNHHYDNTNHYNNTTTVEGGDVLNNYEDNHYSNTNYSLGGGNGSTSNYPIYYIDFEFSLPGLWGHNEEEDEEIDHMNNSFVYENYSYYDYLQNMWITEDFTIQCSVYYIVGSGSNSSHGSNIVTYWEDNDWYDQAWDDMGYNTTMRELFQQAAGIDDLRLACDENYNPNDGGFSGYYEEVIFSFTIPEGMALHCSQDVGGDAPVLWSLGGSGGNNGTSWIYWSQADVSVDGMPASSCGWGLGGPRDMVVEIYEEYLYYNYDYRLTWSYTLVPVIPSE
jgi:hypothetical protein